MLRPGTFLWLVAHDLRLNWRRFVDMFGGATPTRALIFGAIGLVALHGLAWPAVPLLDQHLGASAGPEGRLLVAGLLVFMASWMVAQGLFTSTRTLYDRGDLDLLLGSPLSPRLVLGAKALAIALSSLGSISILALPIANVGAFRSGAHWLALYPALAGIALGATAVALAACVGLFRLVGPRRARHYAHMAGALIGGGFVLAAQIVAMLPDDWRNAITTALAPAASPNGWTPSLLWLPVDAALGEPMALLAFVATAAAMFSAAAALLGESFARASLVAAGAPSLPGTAAKAASRPVRFRSGAAAALRRKEWRLLLRDPSLFAQIGLQIVYTIPLAVMLLKGGSLPVALAIAPAIVVIASQVSASLAWLAVSGEDAPELIASAPVKPLSVDAAKLSAIALPVVAIAALPLAGLALASPKAAALSALFAAGGSASSALLNLWHPMPGNRRGMLRRHSQSKLIGLLEHLIAILWAVAAVLALLGSGLWPVPLLLSLVVLGHGRLTSRQSPAARAITQSPGLPAVAHTPTR